MKPPRWRNLRRGAGLIILGLFLFAFLGQKPAAISLAAFLARVQLGPSLVRLFGTKGAAFPAPAVILPVVLLLSAVFLGRWYCSFLCPFGLVQDAMLRRRKKRKPFRYIPSMPLLRYGLLLLVIGTALAGALAVLNLTEPYAWWGRLVRDLLIPLLVLANRGLAALADLVGVYIFHMEYTIDIPVFLVTAAAAVLLLYVTRRFGRVYCSVICPVGTLLGGCHRIAPAAIPRWGIVLDADACISCGRCEGVCRTGCIDSAAKKVDRDRCVLCGDCLGICPEGALGYGRLPDRRDHVDGSGRRGFLKRFGFFSALTIPALVFPLSLPAGKRDTDPLGEANTPATPPGSRGIRRFTSLCISCHLCVNKCPTGVLSPSLAEYGLRGLFQPVMDYHSGFCEYECTRCGEVCPTGAILPLSPEGKKTIQIGRVEFLRDRCVVVTNGTVCGACAEVCPTHAVGMEPFGSGLTLPVTDNALCVGCGSCEYACPVPGKAIYVRGLAVHATAEVRAPLYAAPIEVETEEFPF